MELDLEAARRRAGGLAAAGAALAKAGYGERSVCAWFGAQLVSDARFLGPPPADRSRRGLGAAIALFLAGEMLERRALSILDDAQVDTLVAVGLLSRHGGVLRARVSITPIGGVVVCADRLDDAGVEAVGAPDLSAYNVAACLPQLARGGTLLDVGCGAGALSLHAARTGVRVCGTDVDPRAIRFACVNALLNALPAAFIEGDLFAGIADRFDAVIFNAPLVRAPLAGDAPLYLKSPRGESLVVEFLAGARERTSVSGEALCHTQLTPSVEAAIDAAGFPRALSLVFADAPDGTPHALTSLRSGVPHPRARLRTPLSPALPHLRRELFDRLHATRDLLAAGELEFAVLRPAPWLAMVHTAVHDGATFRPRDLRFGAQRIDDADARLLAACDGRPLGIAAADDWNRALSLVEHGLLVA